jgi:hypothetical protein
MNLPVDFQQLAQGPVSASGTGYPHRIKASDLQKNFVYAAADVDTTGPNQEGQNGLSVREAAGLNGFTQRYFSCVFVPKGTDNELLVCKGGEWTLIKPPANGTRVLGSVGGVVQWLETESCT